MKTIELQDRVIFRAEKGKKLRFIGNATKFPEISVRNEHKETIKIEEVDE